MVGRFPLLLMCAAVVGGCSDSTDKTDALPAQNLVLYTKGLSSDPYGLSKEAGFGVVLDIGEARQRSIEIQGEGLGSFGGAQWLNGRRILVPRPAPPIRSPLLYRIEDGRLKRLGAAPVPPLEAGAAWSPDGRRIAVQPIKACKKGQRTVFECYRGSGRVLVRDAGGGHPRVVAKGRFVNFDSWTPDGRLLVTAGRTYAALDVETGRRSVPLVPGRIGAVLGLSQVWISAPRWSADGRYLAAMIAYKQLKVSRVAGVFLLAHADGRPIRLVTSPYLISMFAWSPTGHRLAYTTSGFPSPHQLLLLDKPTSKPRPLLVTTRHFDWITWSPDGRRLLLDDEHTSRWRIVRAVGRRGIRSLPRLGGRPFWCCPVNSYETH